MKPFNLPPLPAAYRPAPGAIEKMVEENKAKQESRPPSASRRRSSAAAAASRKRWVATHRKQWNAYMREWRRKKREVVIERELSITPPSPDPQESEA